MSKKLISLALVSGLFGFSSTAFADGMCICLDPPACTQQVCPEDNNQTAQPTQPAQTTTTQPAQTTTTQTASDTQQLTAGDEIVAYFQSLKDACERREINPETFEAKMLEVLTGLYNRGIMSSDEYANMVSSSKEIAQQCRDLTKGEDLFDACANGTITPEQFQIELTEWEIDLYRRGVFTQQQYNEVVSAVPGHVEECRRQQADPSYSPQNTNPLFYDASQSRGIDMTKDRVENVMVFDFGLGVTGGAYLPFYDDGVMGDVNLNLTIGFMVGGSKLWQSIHYSHGFQVETHLGYAKVADRDTDMFLGITDCMFTPAFYITDDRNLIFELGIGVSFVYTNSSVWGIGIPIRLGILYYFNDNWAFGVHFVAHSNFVIGDEDRDIEEALNTYSIGTEAMLQLVYRPNFYKDEVYFHMDD